MKVLITGGNGQLGQCINFIKDNYPELELCFTNSKELDITNNESVRSFFNKNQFDYVINCAAYTNVEQAEREPEKAFLVNAQGVKSLAEICRKYNIVLIHISTDYVFDGEKRSPYTEKDMPNPINEYGKSKLLGEYYIQEILEKYFVIRTSWLYSQFGNNFYKTIIKKSKNEKKLTITNSEIGAPTNANDLAKFLFHILKTGNINYGLYHLGNLGSATWYDFAKEILKNSGNCEYINLEKTDNYPTFAERPKYSVLDGKKSIETFNSEILNWKISLKSLHRIITE